jgi:peptide/nickel transport system permease protein
MDVISRTDSTRIVQKSEIQSSRRRRQIVRFLRRRPIAVIGILITLVLLIVAIFAPLFAPYDPSSQAATRLLPPGLSHLMGTDNLGRDVFSRVLFGTRASMYVGFVSVAISLVVGGVLGVVAAYRLGIIDTIIMRIMDIIFAFPTLILILAISAVVGPSLTTATIVIGLVYVPRFARIARGPALSVMQEPYIEAVRVTGASSARIIFRHVMPNIAAPLIIQTSLSISTAILTEATLSFLGLGVQPPTPSWGVMLANARAQLQLAPWLAIFPGLAIMIAVLAFNILGDDLRDALDPRLRTD